MLAILLLILLAILTYFFAIKPFNYWKYKNVKASKGIPFFGENFWVLLSLESLTEQVYRIYNLFSNERYFGVYFFTTPLLVVKSPDLVKELCVKNFDHFVNRMTLVPDHTDDLFTRNSVSIKGEEWKNVRSTMSPVYTSSKMKVFFNQISHNADKLVDCIMKNDQTILEVELKDLLSRFSNDVIARNIYGVEIDSLKDKNNIFYEMAKKGTHICGYRKKYSILFYQLAPRISAFFRLPLAEKEVQSFFVKLIKDTISIRKAQNITQPDLVGKLIQSTEANEVKTITTKDGSVVKEKNWRTEEIKNDLSVTDIAAVTFFAFNAGFEAISNVLCFVAHQLALNPDIQKRLIDEIDENFADNEMPSYGKLLNMSYLDMVISAMASNVKSRLEIISYAYPEKERKMGIMHNSCND
ncbi:cytochrome P450 9e2-like isoform X2 [Harmonia axyridis]|uniref:cytochrome P450 9e2-like isoform X2 n=1 Tax=Harmonia axyridis TaxID=115357 RepID=UPI001E276937|nr:cytochrome P450 9e2-like isoform X2 [Harmonia axyridis]